MYGINYQRSVYMLVVLICSRRATYVRSDIADAELLESATIFDTIRVGSYKITNVYKPPPTDWTNAALPAHQHPAIYVGDFNSHHATWGYERGTVTVTG